MIFTFLGAVVALAPFTAAFLPPVPPRYVSGANTRLYSSTGTAPSPSLLLNPLAGRQVEIFETEDSTERFIQVTFKPDGTFELLRPDSTSAVDLLGTWSATGEGKVTFVLERVYQDGASQYSMTRMYEGSFVQSGRSIRGEGKVEQEKYNALFTCGYFSLITMDDGPDELFDKVTHRDANDGMIEGLDF